MTRPLVSVLIPMYNASAFIGEALESVADQDYDPIEVIIVDDGSTDDSRDVARASAHDHAGLTMRVLEQPNQGPAVARNTALAAARGTFITLLDADDRMTPGRISFQVDHLERHPESDGIIGTHRNVVDEGVEPPAWLPLMPSPDVLPHYLVLTMMVRAELFDRVGGFDPSYAYAGEDTEWYLRAKTSGAQIDLVDRLLLVRRIHGGNLTYQVEKLDQSLFRILRERTARARSERDR